MKQNLSLTDKLYIAAILLSLVSFALPSLQMVIAGEPHNLFFISTYSGQIVFANLLVFAGLVQAIVFARSKKWLYWIGLVCGMYAGYFAIDQLYKCFIRFETHEHPSLVDKLHPQCFPLAGVWLLLAAGILLAATAAVKIVQRSMQKQA